MDGELSEFEQRRLLADLGRDESLRATWSRYHLIREALRNELERAAGVDFAGRVAARVQDLAPVGGPVSRPMARVAATLAIAASVAAAAVIGLQVLSAPEEPLITPVASRGAAPDGESVRAGATRWSTNQPEVEHTLNSYLVEHNEFAPSTGISGMLPYVRVVGYDNDQ